MRWLALACLLGCGATLTGRATIDLEIDLPPCAGTVRLVLDSATLDGVPVERAALTCDGVDVASGLCGGTIGLRYVPLPDGKARIEALCDGKVILSADGALATEAPHGP